MFEKKIKVVDEHYQIINQLAKDTNSNNKEVGYNLIEMGIALLISSRKIAIDGRDGLQATIEELSKGMVDDAELLRFSQLLEKYWNAGQNK